jgi:hypothetical protein
MKHIPTFQQFINESTITMGIKAEKFANRVGNLRGKSKTAPISFKDALSKIASMKFPEAESEQIEREIREEFRDLLNDALKNLNIQPADAMVCFTARPGYSDDLVYIADRCDLDYENVQDPSVGDDVIVFSKNQ